MGYSSRPLMSRTAQPPNHVLYSPSSDGVGGDVVEMRGEGTPGERQLLPE